MLNLSNVGFLLLTNSFVGTFVPQAIMGCLEGEDGHSIFQRLLAKVKDESLDPEALVSLLRLYQDSNPAVKAAFSDRKSEDVAVATKGRKSSLQP